MLKIFNAASTNALRNQIQKWRAFAQKACPPKAKGKKKSKKPMLPLATMNDLPVPSGDWYQAYAVKSSKYNKIFFSGTIAFFGSVAYLISSPPFEMNYSIPDIDE